MSTFYHSPWAALSVWSRLSFLLISCDCCRCSCCWPLWSVHLDKFRACSSFSAIFCLCILRPSTSDDCSEIWVGGLRIIMITVWWRFIQWILPRRLSKRMYLSLQRFRRAYRSYSLRVMNALWGLSRCKRDGTAYIIPSQTLIFFEAGAKNEILPSFMCI